jgi:hypothetical protein
MQRMLMDNIEPSHVGHAAREVEAVLRCGLCKLGARPVSLPKSPSEANDRTEVRLATSGAVVVGGDVR